MTELSKSKWLSPATIDKSFSKAQQVHNYYLGPPSFDYDDLHRNNIT